jgi:hypothetical protein
LYLEIAGDLYDTLDIDKRFNSKSIDFFKYLVQHAISRQSVYDIYFCWKSEKFGIFSHSLTTATTEKSSHYMKFFLSHFFWNVIMELYFILKTKIAVLFTIFFFCLPFHFSIFSIFQFSLKKFLCLLFYLKYRISILLSFVMLLYINTWHRPRYFCCWFWLCFLPEKNVW